MEIVVGLLILAVVVLFMVLSKIAQSVQEQKVVLNFLCTEYIKDKHKDANL